MPLLVRRHDWSKDSDICYRRWIRGSVGVFSSLLQLGLFRSHRLACLIHIIPSFVMRMTMCVYPSIPHKVLVTTGSRETGSRGLYDQTIFRQVSVLVI